MNEATKPRLPIGYWLKRADRLITEQVNIVQAANNVTRTDWQIINTLYEIDQVSKEQLFDVMHVFVDAVQLEQILADLIERGWVTASASGVVTYQLSDNGRRQHSQILTAQQEIRLWTMQGISEADYATVMWVLQQMVVNLETAVSGGSYHGK